MNRSCTCFKGAVTGATKPSNYKKETLKCKQYKNGLKINKNDNVN